MFFNYQGDIQLSGRSSTFWAFFNYQVMPWVERGKLEMILSDFEPAPLPLSLVYPHTRLMAMRVRTLVNWLARDLKHSLAS